MENRLFGEKQIGNSAASVIIELVLPSKSLSGMGLTEWVGILNFQTREWSKKQWVEPESTKAFLEKCGKASEVILSIKDVQWLTKLSQCLVLLDYSLNSFEFKTYINKVLVYQRKNLIRAMQPLENYVIPIRGDEDMGNLNQGPIDSVLWDGIRTIRIWCSIYYITCNPW